MEEKIFSLMLWPIWCLWLEQSNPSPRLHWSAAAGVLTNTNTNTCQCHFKCFPKQIETYLDHLSYRWTIHLPKGGSGKAQNRPKMAFSLSSVRPAFNAPRVNQWSTHRRRCTPGIKDSQLEKVGAAPSRLHWSSSRLQSGFRPCNIATITSFVLLTAYSLTQKYWNMCLEPIFGYLAEQADAPSLISLIS